MSTQERVKILADATPNTWIALSQDESRVIAEGADFMQAVENASAAGETDPVMIRIPDAWRPMVL
ncbi:MAG TPA: hypothetical protein VML01_00045 [Bryobacterales bacterium]|nr:hypothetical protein [Bryobacterales bacterium]